MSSQPIKITPVYFCQTYSPEFLEAYFTKHPPTESPYLAERKSTSNDEQFLPAIFPANSGALSKKFPQCTAPILAPFYLCHLNYFGEHTLHQTNIDVCFVKAANALVVGKEIDPQNPEKRKLQYPYCHAVECPCRDFELLSLPKQKELLKDQLVVPNVRIGVAILITNEKDEVLLTRRPRHMRTFPRAWVVPGGHLDFGETLEQAGLREIYEETGVRLGPEHIKILGIYESVYPIVLRQGHPSRHHVLVYLTGQIDTSKSDFQLEVDPNEVDATCWTLRDHVDQILNKEPSSDVCWKGMQYEYEEKKWRETQFSLWNFDSRVDEKGNYPDERLSTGTKFILREWLKLSPSNLKQN